jgi:hypothetical protein
MITGSGSGRIEGEAADEGDEEGEAGEEGEPDMEAFRGRLRALPAVSYVGLTVRP